MFIQFFAVPAYSQNYGSEEELKKNALELFDNNKYLEALPLFSQLVSLYPSDPDYNYKYGTCLLFGDADKSKSLNYLKFSAAKPNIDPKCYYFYGRALHLNYDFRSAINYYEKFNTNASGKDKKLYSTERYITMCKNGQNLLQNPNDVAVLGKQEIKRSDFFRAYSLDEIGGKIVVKPEDFKSKYDLKVNEYSLVYLPNNPTMIYYSSYGDSESKGKDIFRIRKTESGEWGEPENLGAPINTEYDEDYPFFHQTSNTLYFSSKGHNSMGGYDIFKTTYNEATGTWSTPKNLDFAISSADDDILFISNQDNEIAYFASSRYSLNNYISVYKVLISKRPIELTVVKGKFINEAYPGQKKAKITVMDAVNEELLGTFNTDPVTGEYVINLPTSGGIVKFILETTEDAPIHTGKVNIPSLTELVALKQELRLVGEGAAQKLVIKNLFDAENSEPIDASLISDFIRKKAQLDVNTNEEEVANLLARGSNEGPTLIRKDDTQPELVSGPELTGQEMIANVQKEINRLESEIALKDQQRKFVYKYTMNMANKADDLFTTNENILNDIGNDPNAEDRKQLEKELLENRRKVNPLASEAIAGYNLAGGLSNEVKEKKIELRSLKEAMAVLRSKVNAGNKEDMTEVYQDASDKIRNVKDMSTTFEIAPSRQKEQYNQKLQEVKATESYLAGLRQEQEDLKNEINRNKKEVENLKGKKKESMLNQIQAFELDLEDIGFEADNIEKKFKKEDAELKMMKSEMDLTKELIGKIEANKTNANELTAEESLQLDELIDYFKEQNLLNEILGEEVSTEIAINKEISSNQQSLTYYPPFNEDGSPTDYDAKYQAEKQIASKIEDKEEREEALVEIYENWNRSIAEDIIRKKELLASTSDKQQKKALEIEIESLTIARNDKKSELKAIQEPKETAQSYPDVSSDDGEKSYSKEELLASENPLSPINKEGEPIDYNRIYEQSIEEIKSNPNENERKARMVKINGLWVLSLEAEIDLKKAQLNKTKDPKERKAIEEEIAALEEIKTQKSEELLLASNEGSTKTQETETVESANTQNTTASDQTNNTTATNRTNNTSTTSTGAAASTIPVTYQAISKNPSKITNEEGEVYNYDDAYEAEYAAAIESKKPQKQQEVVEQWNSSSDAEIELLKQQLKELQSKEQKAMVVGEIAIIEMAKVARTEAARTNLSLAEVESLKPGYQALNEEPSAISYEGSILDYDLLYQKELAILNQSGDEQTIEALAEKWTTSREAHVEVLEQQSEEMSPGTDRDEILAIIAELKRLNTAGGIPTAENEIAVSSSGKSSEQYIEPVDENGEEINYKQKYSEKLAAVENLELYEKLNAQADINSNLMQTVAADIELKKKQLEDAKKKKDRKELEEMIAELEAYYANQEEIDKKIKAELGIVEAERTENKKHAAYTDESLTVKYKILEYDSEASQKSIASAGEMLIEVVEIEQEIRQLQQQMEGEENTFEQERIISEIRKLQKSSKEKQLQIAVAFEEANKKELLKRNEQLTSMSAKATPVNRLKGDEKSKEAGKKMIEADGLRKRAASVNDYQQKMQLFSQAYNLEIEALKLQKEAIVLYDVGETAEVATTEGESEGAVNKATSSSTNEEPFVISQQEVDEIEENELFQQYVTDKKDAERIMKSADVEYVKAEDLRKESEKQKTMAAQKREEAEKAKKKRDQKRLVAEAEALEAAAALNTKKADSIYTYANTLKVDSEVKSKEARQNLKAIGNDDEYEKLLAYYEAKLKEVLEIREEKKFASTEGSDGTLTSNYDDLPLATELTAEEFRKLDFKAIQTKVEKDLFVKAKSNSVSAYNATKPIPIDEVELPEGIVYKVQIGAFRNPIPQDLFKGFAPVNGERTSSGITRYTAGIFKAYGTADKAKEEIRALGYSDAFVVAFRNGQRISITEARAATNELAESTVNTGSTGVVIPNTTTNSTNTSNNTQTGTNNNRVNNAIATEAPDVSGTTGMFYTVQVGVYANNKIPSQLESIRPLNSEITPRNYVRYTSGRFDSFEEAVEWRKQLVARGITDAFVTAYLNGNRISVGEARNYRP